MKTRLIAVVAAVCFAAACFAKDIKTVVLNTTPEMHCMNCENKIKSNIRFEKGVKEIETNLENKTVTVKYDADKTTVEKIVAGFGKIGYTATVACDEAEKAGSCCSEKKESNDCCGKCPEDKDGEAIKKSKDK